MTDWSKHVHRFAKKHNMSYKQASRSRKCKETYKKRKTSPRRKMSPRRRRTSPRRKGNKKRRMNNYDDEDDMKTAQKINGLAAIARDKFWENEYYRTLRNNETGLAQWKHDSVDMLKQYMKAEGLTEAQAEEFTSDYRDMIV